MFEGPPPQGSTRPRYAGPVLDPLLTAASAANCTATAIKQEVPSPPIYVDSIVPDFPRLHRPRLHLWSTNRPASSDAVPLEYSSPLLPPIGFYGSHERPEPSVHVPSGSIEDERDEDEGGSEATRLKGVFWPGMDIFDSATLLMRRKRNQKKDVSVLEQLEQNSLEVEPTELIFTPYGTLKKQRVISGQVNFDSSPLKYYHPPPPKRRASVRYPLAEKDPNIKRGARVAVMIEAPPGFQPVTQGQSDAEAGPPQQQRKRAFAVFDERQQQPFGNPTGMPTLTSEFYYSQQRYTDYHTMQIHTSEHPAFEAKQTPPYEQNFFTEAFENYQPYHALQPFFGGPYHGYAFPYGYYGNPGYDIPGFFTNPPLQQPAPYQAEEAGQHDGAPDEKDEKIDHEDCHTISATSDD